jgi:hypothetical protein
MWWGWSGGSIGLWVRGEVQPRISRLIRISDSERGTATRTKHGLGKSRSKVAKGFELIDPGDKEVHGQGREWEGDASCLSRAHPGGSQANHRAVRHKPLLMRGRRGSEWGSWELQESHNRFHEEPPSHAGEGEEIVRPAPSTIPHAWVAAGVDLFQCVKPVLAILNLADAPARAALPQLVDMQGYTDSLGVQHVPPVPHRL